MKPAHAWRRLEAFTFLVVHECTACGVQRLTAASGDYRYGINIGAGYNIEPECRPEKKHTNTAETFHAKGLQ